MSMSDQDNGFAAAQTVIRFFRCLDERDYRGMAALLAPDGVWSRQGQELRGESDLLAAMERRSASLRVHHLLSNLLTETMGEDRANVTAYMLVVRHDGGAAPAPLEGIASIRTLRARLRRAPTGWLIERLGGDPPSFARAG
jgi:hypothetical protein